MAQTSDMEEKYQIKETIKAFEMELNGLDDAFIERMKKLWTSIKLKNGMPVTLIWPLDRLMILTVVTAVCLSLRIYAK